MARLEMWGVFVRAHIGAGMDPQGKSSETYIEEWEDVMRFLDTLPMTDKTVTIRRAVIRTDMGSDEI